MKYRWGTGLGQGQGHLCMSVNMGRRAKMQAGFFRLMMRSSGSAAGFIVLCELGGVTFSIGRLRECEAKCLKRVWKTFHLDITKTRLRAE